MRWQNTWLIAEGETNGDGADMPVMRKADVQEGAAAAPAQGHLGGLRVQQRRLQELSQERLPEPGESLRATVATAGNELCGGRADPAPVKGRTRARHAVTLQPFGQGRPAPGTSTGRVRISPVRGPLASRSRLTT